MGESMMISGEADTSFRIGSGLKMAPGLGFATSMLIDQHFAERGRIGRLIGAVAHNPKYLGMYNKYIATLEAEELSNPAKAIEIAELEIRNRPTPQSYDLLAWGYYQQGQIEKAVKVAQHYVEGKTFEPEAIYHLGLIYHNLDEKKSQKFLGEASESSFELGPAITENIQLHLK